MAPMGDNSDSDDDMPFAYTIPEDVRARVIDIGEEFTGHDPRNFDLIQDESEMVQSVLISNDEIKARCRALAK
jgi:hypothetical protein